MSIPRFSNLPLSLLAALILPASIFCAGSASTVLAAPQPDSASSKGSQRPPPVTTAPNQLTSKVEPTWLDQHAGEPGFGTVTYFMLGLSEIQYHSRNESEHSSEWGGGDTAIGLKTLYELSPQKAVWVSKFWRLKARIAEQDYLDALATRYSKMEDFSKRKKDLDSDLEDALKAYYYDHWQEIEDMIRFNLQMAATEKDQK